MTKYSARFTLHPASTNSTVRICTTSQNRIHAFPSSDHLQTHCIIQQCLEHQYFLELASPLVRVDGAVIRTSLFFFFFLPKASHGPGKLDCTVHSLSYHIIYADALARAISCFNSHVFHAPTVVSGESGSVSPRGVKSLHMPRCTARAPRHRSHMWWGGHRPPHLQEISNFTNGSHRPSLGHTECN
jgi:hypothetical protein